MSQPAWGAKVPGNGSSAPAPSARRQPTRARRTNGRPAPVTAPPNGRPTSRPATAPALRRSAQPPPLNAPGQTGPTPVYEPLPRTVPVASGDAHRRKAAVASPAVAGTPGPQRVRRARALRRGRRVKRIVRRIDLWSVLKLSLVLYACLYASILLAVAGLWGFLNSAGLVDRFESFMRDIGFDRWEFHGPEMFRGVAIVGGILVLTGTLLTLLAMSLVNVVSELTGGIRFTVIEEEVFVVGPAAEADTTGSRRARKQAKEASQAANGSVSGDQPDRGRPRRRRDPGSGSEPKTPSPAGV